LEFTKIFEQVLPQYLGGESPIGISLTGGLDTRMIMACIPSHSQAFVAFTFAGLSGRTEDARIAARAPWRHSRQVESRRR